MGWQAVGSVVGWRPALSRRALGLVVWARFAGLTSLGRACFVGWASRLVSGSPARGLLGASRLAWTGSLGGPRFAGPRALCARPLAGSASRRAMGGPASRALWALRSRPSAGRSGWVWCCCERRVRGMTSAVKGALPALSAGNAPFTATAMPSTRLSQQLPAANMRAGSGVARFAPGHERAWLAGGPASRALMRFAPRLFPTSWVSLGQGSPSCPRVSVG